MMNSFRKLALAVLFMGWFALPSTGHAQTACPTNLGSLNGSYGMLVSGGNIADGSAKYLVAAVQFDGGTSAADIQNNDGTLSALNVYGPTGSLGAMTGTYVLNADCTLTLTMNIGSSATPQVYTVGVRSSTAEALGVEVDNNAVATIDLQAQGASGTAVPTFTSASANGTFAAACSGSTATPNIFYPVNAAALATDLNQVTLTGGTISGTDTYNNGGTSTFTVPYTGNYTVNTDGTVGGNISIEGGNFDFFGVLSNSGAKFQYFYSNGSIGAPSSAFAVCTGLAQTTTPTFTLAPASSNISVASGSSVSNGITVTDINGFSGAISFSAAGVPNGASYSFSPTSSASGTTFAVTVPASANVAPGNYSIIVTGSATGASGPITQITSFNLNVTSAVTPPSFNLVATSGSLTETAGQPGSDGITVTPANGFTGTVVFSVTGALPTGSTTSFTPLSSTTGSTFSVTVPATTPASNIPLTIIGTSGTLTASTPVTLVVSAAPSFTLSPASPTLTVGAGSSGTDAITVTAVNGFNGTVGYSVTGAPTGATVTFTGNTMNVSTLSSTATGSYTLTITGTSGTITAQTSVSLSVTGAQSFTLAPTYNPRVLNPGTSLPDPIIVTPVNGFTGTVSFNVTGGVPAGTTATFSGNILTLAVGTTTTPGNYPINFTGTSGSIVVPGSVMLVVNQPGFTLAPASSTLTLSAGSSGNDAITVTPVNGFSGTVSYGVSGAPAGVSVSFTGNTMNVSTLSSTATGSYTLIITGTSGTITAQTSVKLSISGAPSFTLSPAAPSVTVNPGSAGSDSITVTPVNGFTGTVSFNVTGGVPAGTTATFSGNTLSLAVGSTTAPGSYKISFTGTSGSIVVPGSITLLVNQPGFTLAPASSTLTLSAGSSGSDAITVTPVNGFTGTVSYSVTGAPTGATVTFSGNTMTVSTASTTASGSYTLSITGTSGTLTAKTSVSLSVTAVKTFTLAPTYNPRVLNPGTSLPDPIIITPVNGFSGTVSFAVTSGVPAGTTASFSGSILTLAVGTTTVAGSYTINFTGTSGSLVVPGQVTLVVNQPGFTLTPASPTLTVGAGFSGSDAINVTPVNGFTGEVSYSVTGAPAGATITFSGNTMTVSTASTTTPGTYTLAITGTSGNIKSSTAVSLTVGSMASFTLAPTSTTLPVAPNSSVTDVIIVTPLNGFTGTVSYTASGEPSGASVSFSGNTLKVTTSSNVAAGSYTLSITGTSGTIKASTSVKLTITAAPSFTLAPTYNPRVLNPGTGLPDPIIITALNGFKGTVTFAVTGSLPTGVTASFSGATINLFAGTNSVPGTYTINFNGTSGSIVVPSSVTLVVNQPSFTLTPSYNPRVLNPGTGLPDPIGITPINGFSGTVTFAVTGSLPTGVTASFSGATINIFAGTNSVPGTYTINFTGTSGSIKVPGTVTLVVQQPGFSIAPTYNPRVLNPGTSLPDPIIVTDINGFSGAVSFAVTGGVPAGTTASFSGNILTLAVGPNTAAGQYPISIRGTSGSLSATTTVTLEVTGFTLTPSASTLTLSPNSGLPDTITVTPLDDFQGSVSLAFSTLPKYASARFAGNVFEVFAASNTPAGTYPITITGTYNAMKATTTVTLVVR